MEGKMITDNYIKMCEQAGEIQKEWKPKILDKEISKNALTNNNYSQDAVSYIEDFEHPYNEYYYKNYGFIYLPTLEQLFEIWSYLCNTNNSAHPNYLAGDHLPTNFINEIYNYLKNHNREWFDKELCLKIIMRDFYHKVWTGEKWEAIT